MDRSFCCNAEKQLEHPSCESKQTIWLGAFLSYTFKVAWFFLVLEICTSEVSQSVLQSCILFGTGRLGSSPWLKKEGEEFFNTSVDMKLFS